MAFLPPYQSCTRFRSLLKGEMGEVEWEMTCDLYTSFFSTTRHNERDLNLDWLMERGGPLLCIFKLLRAVVLDKHARKHDIFSNGFLFYEFFTLHARQDYLVAISTMGHPFQDWCGQSRPRSPGLWTWPSARGPTIIWWWGR